MPIYQPGNYNEIINYSLQHPSELVVVDCKATWCGPCKALHPEMVKLSNQTVGNVKFMEVDIDDPEHEDTVSKFQVTAMPTIIYLVGGNQVMDRTVGANLVDIKTKVNLYLSQFGKSV